MVPAFSRSILVLVLLVGPVGSAGCIGAKTSDVILSEATGEGLLQPGSSAGAEEARTVLRVEANATGAVEATLVSTVAEGQDRAGNMEISLFAWEYSDRFLAGRDQHVRFVRRDNADNEADTVVAIGEHRLQWVQPGVWAIGIRCDDTIPCAWSASAKVHAKI